MSSTIIPFDTRLSLKARVSMNIWIAQDLADCFGGRLADYLIPLNKNLKKKLIVNPACKFRRMGLAA